MSFSVNQFLEYAKNDLLIALAYAAICEDTNELEVSKLIDNLAKIEGSGNNED